jgi:hypothetical protein
MQILTFGAPNNIKLFHLFNKKYLNVVYHIVTPSIPFYL